MSPVTHLFFAASSVSVPAGFTVTLSALPPFKSAASRGGTSPPFAVMNALIASGLHASSTGTGRLTVMSSCPVLISHFAYSTGSVTRHFACAPRFCVTSPNLVTRCSRSSRWPTRYSRNAFSEVFNCFSMAVTTASWPAASYGVMSPFSICCTVPVFSFIPSPFP